MKQEQEVVEISIDTATSEMSTPTRSIKSFGHDLDQYLDKMLDAAVAGDTPWILKPGEIYKLLQEIALSTDEKDISMIATLIESFDVFADQLMKATGVISPEDGYSIISEIDNFVVSWSSRADQNVDSNYKKLIESLKRLKVIIKSHIEKTLVLSYKVITDLIYCNL